MTTGERIKKRRRELEWSQRELADKMGYTNHSTIARIESGKVDLPQSRIVQFAKVMNTTVSYLMGWEEIQKNNDIIADITIRMQTDPKFLEAAKVLFDLDSEKLSSFLTLFK